MKECTQNQQILLQKLTKPLDKSKPHGNIVNTTQFIRFVFQAAMIF
jgi:hypothetical protein